jgi:hypothetical protein
MVRGLELFGEVFKGYTDQYVLIGGAASFLATEELGVSFRPTNDLDIVLCVESLSNAFAEQFWNFIDEGGYANRQLSCGSNQFYRFDKPKSAEYPKMLELFSRNTGLPGLREGTRATPIPFEGAAESLSALLMNDDYYDFIHQYKRQIRGVSAVGAECLIPLKAKAFTDLSERKRQDPSSVASKDVTKHKLDIFRLLSVLDTTVAITVPESIKADLQNAFVMILTEEVDLKNLGYQGPTVQELIDELRVVYGISTTA